MSKITLILLSVLFFTHCTNMENPKLVQGLKERDANNILLILSNNAIQAKKEIDKDGTYFVTVEPKNQMMGLRVLSDFGEPQTQRESMGTIFHKDNMISSPMEEFARYTFALDQDLEKTLSQIDGVISVRVHVSLPMPSDNLWSSEAIKPGAAIFIKYRSGNRLDLFTNRIKLLVSKAVPGLTANMVEIFPLEKKDK